MAPRTLPASCMKLCTNFGFLPRLTPSMSCITSTWPAVPLPAPMPMVWQCASSAVSARESGAGTISSTSMAAPASCSSAAWARSWRAAASSLPCTR